MGDANNHRAKFCESFFGHVEIFNRAIFEITLTLKYPEKCGFWQESNKRIKICNTKMLDWSPSRTYTVPDRSNGKSYLDSRPLLRSHSGSSELVIFLGRTFSRRKATAPSKFSLFIFGFLFAQPGTLNSWPITNIGSRQLVPNSGMHSVASSLVPVHGWYGDPVITIGFQNEFRHGMVDLPIYLRLLKNSQHPITAAQNEITI